jgi:hypothetical protein
VFQSERIAYRFPSETFVHAIMYVYSDMYRRF